MSVTYEPGDRIWRWYDSGIGCEPQVLTVVRMNKVTATVADRYGIAFRLPLAQVEGLWVHGD